MTKRMLVDATHPEETRVAIIESHRDFNKLIDFDFSLASKPILRGNIYLAEVMRVEPSLQAAFVEYGGNRHGFLPFSEIHPDYFRIPVADRRPGEDPASAEPTENGNPEEPGTDELADSGDEGSVHSEGEETPPVDPAAESPLPLPFDAGFPDEGDQAVGLITDFGNAAVGGTLTEVAMPEAPPENVGGDVSERFVRSSRHRYKIQEVVKRGQIMLVQVVKEERGNKGAALTSFLSLAGRYCVLMPNTDHGGGVSRKITNHQDRRRMKEILDQLDIPEGMAVILRTAGMEQDPPEIQRDLDYLLRLWDNIREQTLQSFAPNLIYEEANLIKRSMRDLYARDIDEILIAGREGFERAREFMRAVMPDQIEKIRLYEEPIPLFVRYQVENQIDALHDPVAQLRSGGYLVINPTEALVSIDVNSGRATRERHIEETALKTNLEAADEIARQLRLRDLAGLVVIDFIDMEDGRNNAAVERRLKEAMSSDRARLQIGRISPFGLMELSRQRLRPSLTEINFEKCPHCAGTGYVRSADSAALSALRAVEEEALRGRASELTLHLPSAVSVYILNNKRDVLSRFESQYGVKIIVVNDETMPPSGYKLERIKGRVPGRNEHAPAVNTDRLLAEVERDIPVAPSSEMVDEEPRFTESNGGQDDHRSGRREPKRRFRKGGSRGRRPEREEENRGTPVAQSEAGEDGAPERTDEESENQRRRRRGRRGGRRRFGSDRYEQTPGNGAPASVESSAPFQAPPIPVSIHDLDTTPRPLAEEKAQTRASSSHETVNPPGETAKAGWWRRITGQ